MAGYTGMERAFKMRRDYVLKICSLDVKQQPIRARMCGFGDKVGAFQPEFVISKPYRER